MKLHQLMNLDELDRAIGEGYVTVRESGDGQEIYNYTDKCQRQRAWDNVTRNCRGLIVDIPTTEIIARPWAKFFNWQELDAQITSRDMFRPVQVTDKLDGSLGILHRDPLGKPRVATRGSFHSEQAIWATEWLREHAPGIGWLHYMTPLVEIIYPENRIVIDYKGFEGLRLLGFVNIDHGTYLGPSAANLAIFGAPYNLFPAETFSYKTLHDALEAPPRKNAEGMCVRFLQESRIVKVKQEDYVELHRIITGLSERTIWQRMVDGGSLDDLLDGTPDELQAWVTEVWNRITDEMEDIFGDVTFVYEAIIEKISSLASGYSRKDFALEAAKYPRLRPWLFLAFDFQWSRMGDAILKSLRPKGESRYTNHHTQKEAA